MIQFDRYRVLEYDEALRLWCEDHYDDLGWELRAWSDCEPVSVQEIMAICTAHELARHQEVCDDTRAS